MPMTFQVALIPDTDVGGFVAAVPAMPGCLSEGETIEESLANIREAIEGCLISKYEDGHPYTEDPTERLLELRADPSIRFYDVTVDDPEILYESEMKVVV